MSFPTPKHSHTANTEAYIIRISDLESISPSSHNLPKKASNFFKKKTAQNPCKKNLTQRNSQGYSKTANVRQKEFVFGPSGTSDTPSTSTIIDAALVFKPYR
jgi:hypothetical protein